MAYTRIDEPLLTSTDGAVSHAVPTLSTRGIRIVFKDFEYLLPSNIQRGTIATVLHKMSGYFNPGEMTTIMGPSGCGKSIMMDVLAGRRTKGTVNGEITYAGVKPSQMFLRRVTGYVEQFGTLIENLTVNEMLLYTVELKRPLTESHASKVRAVNDLIEKLALRNARNTKIGDPQLDRGISGGQAKRVNIGIALITNPRVLYMDEPISGLDSYTSNEVMALTKKLVANGLTLISTLHSPTPFVFNLFDKVCLLLGGRVVYFGRRDRAIPYFEPLTTGEVISADSDAEWLTDVIVKADAAGRAEELANIFNESKNKQTIVEEVAGDSAGELSKDLIDEISSGSATVTPWWFAVKTYLKYRAVKNYADLAFWTTRISDKIVLCLLLVTVYFGLGDDFTVDNFTNVSAIFLSWAAFSAFGAAIYIPKFYIERNLFYREHRDGLYRVMPYFIVRMIEEIIVMIIFGLICCVALWYAVKLQGSLALFYVIFMGNFLCGLALAFFFSYCAANIDAAVGGIATYMTTVSLFCGFYIRIEDAPDYIAWYAKISFIRYSFGALLMNHYGSSEEGRSLMVQAGDSADDVVPMLEYFGLDDKDKYEFTAYLFLFAFCFSVLAFLAMQYIRHEKH